LVKKLTAVPLPALKSLDLSASRINDPSLRVLGKTDSLPHLVSVTLAGGHPAFSREGAAEFALSPLGKRLTSLHAGFPDVDRLPPPEPIDIGDGEYAGPFRFL
jgi:hypothetical protein